MEDFIPYIYAWYEKNKRDLPWRETNDPYKIWISEIILQQTRVEQGMNYYLKFIDLFPTVEKLASASEDQVLKLWQGLGYYSRARNLHYTAKFIVSELNGKFPPNYKEILKLKGIGPYTAAAIASIAFDLPHPTVDGNVYRVLSRYFGIVSPIDTVKGKNTFFEVAMELMPQKDTGFHNQALMEFGALQCIPKSPDCRACPVVQTCCAAQRKLVGELPVKLKKTKQRSRFFYYYYIDTGDTTFLEKRTGDDIWKNLYQFPLFESTHELKEEELMKGIGLQFLSSCKPNIKCISEKKKHILSHQVIFARLIQVELKNNECVNGRFLQVNKKDISTFAVPRLVELFLNDLKLN